MNCLLKIGGDGSGYHGKSQYLSNPSLAAGGAAKAGSIQQIDMDDEESASVRLYMIISQDLINLRSGTGKDNFDS